MQPPLFISWPDDQAQLFDRQFHAEHSAVRDSLVARARDCWIDHGPGFLLTRIRDREWLDIQPAIYITLAQWQTSPIFPQFALLQQLREYNPRTQFIHVVIGLDGSPRNNRIMRYAYWVVELAESEMQS